MISTKTEACVQYTQRPRERGNILNIKQIDHHARAKTEPTQSYRKPPHEEWKSRSGERTQVEREIWPSPSLSKRLKASLNSEIWSSVSWSAMASDGFPSQAMEWKTTKNDKFFGSYDRKRGYNCKWLAVLRKVVSNFREEGIYRPWVNVVPSSVPSEDSLPHDVQLYYRLTPLLLLQASSPNER